MKMKVNYVETYLMNPLDDEMMVKIPKTYESLRNGIADPESNFNVEGAIDTSFDTENFGEFLYSVTSIEINNFTIEEPTNLFYLNAYFMILKERNLLILEEELVITTDKLKEMIAELLDIRIEDLNLQRIHDTLQKKEVEQQKETDV
ncbi:hypothetical protein GCM10007358_16620 [Phocicoccus schoeneichii]|uniref:Uncharacterized protein n=1 Tax=Phocicoccus schoeneichii TaxID=1812261 RepID=A0A6V7RMV8_9BACL|nr:hypothetical protein [Jeotgalicoccus schoeneichii]GGH55338.1 hypothetical protein GCM10007358_16620 [Jeotgalicoccus schoeneichii]CAD2079746.1 hypothetical protein JEOSCH030_01701 [Jeotgalicoccus schoeneichii]